MLRGASFKTLAEGAEISDLRRKWRAFFGAI
jgi:hypothetical protein